MRINFLQASAGFVSWTRLFSPQNLSRTSGCFFCFVETDRLWSQSLNLNLILGFWFCCSWRLKPAEPDKTNSSVSECLSRFSHFLPADSRWWLNLLPAWLRLPPAGPAPSVPRRAAEGSGPSRPDPETPSSPGASAGWHLEENRRRLLKLGSVWVQEEKALRFRGSSVRRNWSILMTPHFLFCIIKILKTEQKDQILSTNGADCI